MKYSIYKPHNDLSDFSKYYWVLEQTLDPPPSWQQCRGGPRAASTPPQPTAKQAVFVRCVATWGRIVRYV